jgi:hypothetical protein
VFADWLGALVTGVLVNGAVVAVATYVKVIAFEDAFVV